MNSEITEIRIKGKDHQVPSICFENRTIIATKGWLKTAAVHDEAFVQGEVISRPDLFVARLTQWEIKPDLFTFTQKINDPIPKFNYHIWWDNFAVIPITTYEDWLKSRIKKDVKENLRRAKREGIVVKISEFDENFVKGIKDIYDESIVRQGMRVWHYGKSLSDIRKVHETYRERAEYLGAYLGEELVGFIKMVYVDSYAKTMHVICKQKYFQKRPANALIAKAVEVCEQKRVSHFIYGEYRYPGKNQSSLADFKKRNGFEEFKYPRYFVPLTSKGRLAIRLGLHRGVKHLIPSAVTQVLLKVRSRIYEQMLSSENAN